MRIKPILVTCLLGLAWPLASGAGAEVERVWLTRQSHTPGTVVVNWMTSTPGDSVVRYGQQSADEHTRRVEGSRKLHHVEIPLPERGATYRYRVSTGDQSSSVATFTSLPADTARIAVVANWQSKPDLSAIRADDAHLLLTAGDNISSIHRHCGPGKKACLRPYAALVDRYPELFRSVPVMPVLGNHDKQIRPRGPEPPDQPVYDIEATAFRRFFALPGDEWKWRFELPGFGVRLIALDLNHARDVGTTWQSCHPFEKGSAQFEWYDELTTGADQPFTITLYNEKHSSVRNLAGGAWGGMLHRNRVAITGFGHFAERAEPAGLTSFNTSLQGEGDRYPDPESAFLRSENNYLLLTLDRAEGTVAVEFKNLDGERLGRRTVFEPSAGE